MSKPSRKQPPDSADIRSLEQQIRSAGNFVVPSDDLRPRIIEDARDKLLNRRINRWFFGGVATCAVLWGLSMPFQEEVQRLREAWMQPSNAEVDRMVQQFSTQPEVGPDWALAEAFAQIRAAKAKTLGRMLPLSWQGSESPHSER